MEVRNTTTLPTTNSTPFGQTNVTNAPRFNLELVIVLGALIPLTLIGNSLVCFAFLKYQKVRTATNCFLFSLAISDLAVGLILIPLWIAYIATGGFQKLPQSFGEVWIVLDVTCSVASMANLAGVSVERWYGVCYPFRHMSMTVNYAVLTSIASWVYALGVGLLQFCYDPLDPWSVTAQVCLGLCLPFVIMTISYCAIARKIRQKAMRHSQQGGKEYKTIRTLILLSAIFIVCWLPFAIGTVLVHYCLPCALYVLQRPALHIFPKVLHYANSFVNPILYSMFSPSFKAAFKQMFSPRRRQSGARRGQSTFLNERCRGRGRYKSSTSSSFLTSFKDKRRSTFRDSVRKDSLTTTEKIL